MDMELYAGTMSRYYTQNGIAKDEDEQTNWTAEEAHDTVGKWQERILPELSREGEPPYEPWNEDEEDAYTAHMGWEAFGALLLCTACGVYKQPIPNTLHAGWDFEADHRGSHPGMVVVSGRNLLAAAGGLLLFQGHHAGRRNRCGRHAAGVENRAEPHQRAGMAGG